ncbi:MAG: CopG family ribbon-helix-helix protein [Desulfurococcaceae archaeon]
MTIVTFSLPQDLEKNLNDIVKCMGFLNRSEAIRHALRLLASELMVLESLKGKVLAIIAVVYRRDSQKTKVHRIQHEHGDIINAYFHAHIDNKKCLEIMVVHGDAERLRGLVNGLRGSRGLEQMKVAVLNRVE